MRWVFLLLMMLNAFYYVWHLQQAPLRAKEVVPLAMAKGGQGDIRLLNEPAGDASTNNDSMPLGMCLFLGGDIALKDGKTIEQRLLSLDINSTAEGQQRAPKAGYWVKIAPESQRLVDEALVVGLKQDYPQLKSEIMSCEGIATSN